MLKKLFIFVPFLFFSCTSSVDENEIKRANQFFIDYKIEWVYRLMKDFRKIAPRLPSIPKFIFYVIKNRKNFKWILTENDFLEKTSKYCIINCSN